MSPLNLYLSFFIWFSVAVFAAVLVIKVLRYMRMPIHLRWELYPVPHEPEAEHGGSYYEEEWWKREKKVSKFNELKDMLGEMLFIKRVYHNKRELWLMTYPFHLGIYLMLA